MRNIQNRKCWVHSKLRFKLNMKEVWSMECDKVLASVSSLKAVDIKASGRTIKCMVLVSCTIPMVPWLMKDSGWTINSTEWEKFSVLILPIWLNPSISTISIHLSRNGFPMKEDWAMTENKDGEFWSSATDKSSKASSTMIWLKVGGHTIRRMEGYSMAFGNKAGLYSLIVDFNPLYYCNSIKLNSNFNCLMKLQIMTKLQQYEPKKLDLDRALKLDGV